MLDLCPNVTLHPGKLPRDRGGSPIQNQIRAGETWTYANIIKLVPGLDEGPIYLRERFSLEGNDADGIWWRMTTAGAMLTRRFLAGIASGSLEAAPQDETVEPSVHKRVRPDAACLSPDHQTARAMYDVVRAHNETDANTYVVKAWLDAGRCRLIVDRAAMIAPPLAPNGRSWNLRVDAWCEDQLFDLAFRVNNGEDSAYMTGCDGLPLFLTRFYVVCR
jgi:methionyl-tRNA formyltransferase